jgi:hypothetical protein
MATTPSLASLDTSQDLADMKKYKMIWPPPKQSSTIITEDFKQNLFCQPSGERKASPTIFDEMRWALQHAQDPLGQITQLISEFHGPWVGMSQALMGFVSNLTGIIGKVASTVNAVKGAAQEASAYVAQAKNAMKTLNSLVMVSKIGRINNINCNTMPIELLRQFVNRVQSIHPSVNAFIQMNIGKYPYFQPVSESMCSFGQPVLSKQQVDLTKRLDSDGETTMKSSSRLRRNTNGKLFDTIKPLMDDSLNLVDVMFTRGLQVDNNMTLLHENYSSEKPIAHGHNFTPDVFDKNRSLQAITQCLLELVKKIGPASMLLNFVKKVEYAIQKQPQIQNITTEWGTCTVDELTRPIPHREPALPIASEEDRDNEGC